MRPAVRGGTLGCAIVAVLVACSGKSASTDDDVRTMDQSTQSAGQARPPARGDSAALAALMDSIRAISGEFTKSVGGRWTFSGDNALLARPYDFGDAAVDSLVACLSEEREGNILLDGRRLGVAMSCYQALSRTAYPTEFEDGEGEWAGALEPDASPADIHAAAAAWREVVAKKQYRRA